MERFLVGMFLGLGLAAIAIAITSHHSFKQGQIDALTGNIHYELITHDDSTRTWERIEP